MKPRHYSTMFIAFLIIVSAFIIGCGGGGDGATSNTTTATSPTPTVDAAALDQANQKQLAEGPTGTVVIKDSSTLDAYFTTSVEPQGYSRTSFDGAVVEMNKYWFKSITPDQYKKPFYVLVPKPKSSALTNPADYKPVSSSTPASKVTKKVKKLIEWNYWANDINGPAINQKLIHEQVNAVMEGYPVPEVWWSLFIKNKGDLYDNYKAGQKIWLPQPFGK